MLLHEADHMTALCMCSRRYEDRKRRREKEEREDAADREAEAAAKAAARESAQAPILDDIAGELSYSCLLLLEQLPACCVKRMQQSSLLACLLTSTCLQLSCSGMCVRDTHVMREVHPCY